MKFRFLIDILLFALIDPYLNGKYEKLVKKEQI